MERQSRLSGFSRFFIVLRLRSMNARVQRGGLETGTGFQMNRPRHCGPTGTLYSNGRHLELVRKYNLTSRLIRLLTRGRDVFAAAPLIARSLFFALIRRLPLPKAH